MATTKTRRIRVSIGISKYNITALIILAQLVYSRMSGNTTTFASPSPSLATLSQQTADLVAQQKLVNQKVPGAASVRDTKRDALWTTVEGLANYTQELCDNQPELAVSIIEAAGFKVAKSPQVHKAVLAVKNGAQSGVMDLFANASQLVTHRWRKHVFNWAYTLDNGKSWLSAPPTPEARTTITGLTPLTTVGFRVAVTETTGGLGAWSQVVTAVVH